MKTNPSQKSSPSTPVLLSLFSGAGGLDLGFERAGFKVGLAFDKDLDSVKSYNHNRPQASDAHCTDLEALTLERLDTYWGSQFAPIGVIGGPPCQSFSDANPNADEDDPRHLLPLVYARFLRSLNQRNPVSFFLLENVTGLASKRHQKKLSGLIDELSDAGFSVAQTILDAKKFSVPQTRERLFLVGFNRALFEGKTWQEPAAVLATGNFLSVQTAIGDLPEPLYFSRDLVPADIPHHPNHWCMRPKSRKFLDGTLTVGTNGRRSFKTLSWSEPSITVAYGHREVHVHPNRRRRLSVHEAMLLQSFPKEYKLIGNLSSQITQVSNAVPPLLAEAVALSIAAQIGLRSVIKPLSEPPQNLSESVQTCPVQTTGA